MLIQCPKAPALPAKVVRSNRESEDRRGSLHILVMNRTALEREFVAPPEIHVPIFVDMRGRPGDLKRKRIARQGKRDQCRTGQCGDHVRGSEPPGVRGNGLSCGLK